MAERYCRDNSGVTHAMSPLNNEYTVCGNAWDGGLEPGDEKTWETEDPHAWKPMQKGPVTCESCAIVILGLRGIRVDVPHD